MWSRQTASISAVLFLGGAACAQPQSQRPPQQMSASETPSEPSPPARSAFPYFEEAFAPTRAIQTQLAQQPAQSPEAIAAAEAAEAELWGPPLSAEEQRRLSQRLYTQLYRWQLAKGPAARAFAAGMRVLARHASAAWLSSWHPAASVGPINDGRLLFSAHMKPDRAAGVHTRNPPLMYTVPEAIEHLRAAHAAVRQKHPGGMDLQISDISIRKGGRFAPHFTHRHGRDVDLRYYLLDVQPGDHEHHFVGPDKLDCARLWTFFDTLIERDAVRLIYIDYRLQKRLYQYARQTLKRTPEELEPILSWPKARNRPGAIIRHAKNHFSHMHIRFKTPKASFWGSLYSPRQADALQRRLDIELRGTLDYTVRKGDTLGHIARRHRTTIEAIMQANRLTKKSKLQLGQLLQIPVEPH